ncbi:hypothetical protein [Paraburkholderia fungorum]|uniref:hypothetical protein n=1 Tax=Paraburkholderia fungorum TaxID=134537 RepID=UPI0006989A4A|nr:hypothetical protein [Paraburkholderia fungorum]
MSDDLPDFFDRAARHAPPQESSDRHGAASDWTTRDKRPGEWVLSRDRGMQRYHDAAESNRVATRDGWGLGDEQPAELLK